MKCGTDSICLQMVINDIRQLCLIGIHEFFHGIHLFHCACLRPKLAARLRIHAIEHRQFQYFQDIDKSGNRTEIRFARNLCLYTSLNRVVTGFADIIAAICQYTRNINIIIEECRLSEPLLGKLKSSSEGFPVDLFVITEGDRRLCRLCPVRCL